MHVGNISVVHKIDRTFHPPLLLITNLTNKDEFAKIQYSEGARMNQDLVNIGEVISYGLIFDPKNSIRLVRMNTSDIFESVTRLFQLLDDRGVSYVLVGGIAMLVYVDGRNTQDIDLIISRESLARIPELEVTKISDDFGRAKLGELQVDLLFADHELFRLVSEKHVEQQAFLGRDVPCATIDGMLLLKLFSLPSLYRQGEFSKVRIYENDIASLMERRKPNPGALLDILRPHLLESDVTELEKIVVDIQQRLEIAQERFRDSKDH